MNTFLLSVVASLIGAALWQAAGRILGSVRTPFNFLLSKFSGGVIRRFPDLDKAQKYLDKAVKTSANIRILAVRGFPIIEESSMLNQALLNYCRRTRSKRVQVVIIDPDCEEAKRRAEEYWQITGVEEPNTYLEQVNLSIKKIIDMKKECVTLLELRLHKTPAIFRILLFDQVAFVGFYTKKLTGKTTPILMLKGGSLLYQAFERYFEVVWERSRVFNETSHECEGSHPSID